MAEVGYDIQRPGLGQGSLQLGQNQYRPPPVRSQILLGPGGMQFKASRAPYDFGAVNRGQTMRALERRGASRAVSSSRDLWAAPCPGASWALEALDPSDLGHLWRAGWSGLGLWDDCL